jgi:hypothetical protein
MLSVAMASTKASFDFVIMFVLLDFVFGGSKGIRWLPLVSEQARA